MTSWLFHVPAGAKPPVPRTMGKSRTRGRTRPVIHRSPAPCSPDRSQRILSTGCPGSRMDCARLPCPEAAVESTAASDRTHSDDPAFEVAMNATCRPSGDTAKSAAVARNSRPREGEWETRRARAPPAAHPDYSAASFHRTPRAMAAATIQASRSRLRADVSGATSAADRGRCDSACCHRRAR